MHQLLQVQAWKTFFFLTCNIVNRNRAANLRTIPKEERTGNEKKKKKKTNKFQRDNIQCPYGKLWAKMCVWASDRLEHGKVLSWH